MNEDQLVGLVWQWGKDYNSKDYFYKSLKGYIHQFFISLTHWFVQLTIFLKVVLRGRGFSYNFLCDHWAAQGWQPDRHDLARSALLLWFNTAMLSGSVRAEMKPCLSKVFTNQVTAEGPLLACLMGKVAHMNTNSLKNFLNLRSQTRSNRSSSSALCPHDKTQGSKGRLHGLHAPSICREHCLPPSNAGQQTSTHLQPWLDRDHSAVWEIIILVYFSLLSMLG